MNNVIGNNPTIVLATAQFLGEWVNPLTVNPEIMCQRIRHRRHEEHENQQYFHCEFSIG
jgi:hypothetical protein